MKTPNFRYLRYFNSTFVLIYVLSVFVYFLTPGMTDGQSELRVDRDRLLNFWDQNLAYIGAPIVFQKNLVIREASGLKYEEAYTLDIKRFFDDMPITLSNDDADLYIGMYDKDQNSDIEVAVDGPPFVMGVFNQLRAGFFAANVDRIANAPCVVLNEDQEVAPHSRFMFVFLNQNEKFDYKGCLLNSIATVLGLIVPYERVYGESTGEYNLTVFDTEYISNLSRCRSIYANLLAVRSCMISWMSAYKLPEGEYVWK